MIDADTQMIQKNQMINNYQALTMQLHKDDILDLRDKGERVWRALHLMYMAKIIDTDEMQHRFCEFMRIEMRLQL